MRYVVAVLVGMLVSAMLGPAGLSVLGDGLRSRGIRLTLGALAACGVLAVYKLIREDRKG